MPFGASTEGREPASASPSTGIAAGAPSSMSPFARRKCCVHGTQRAWRPRFNRFRSHLLEQKKWIVPSRRMNIFPVPGSMSFPQKEQGRVIGTR